RPCGAGARPPKRTTSRVTAPPLRARGGRPPCAIVSPMAADSVPAGAESDRKGARTVVGTFVLHLRPVRVPAAAIRFTHTFGLGGMALVLLTLLALTGSLLLLGYTPVPGDAYASIERLEGEVLFGAFVRAIHHWSANLLIL